jgi:isopentenyl-diphosphate delta-isomerase
MSYTTTATETTRITAQNIIRLFPEVVVPSNGNGQSNANDADLEGYDEEQIRLMDEVCIVIDNNDLPIATGSKKLCQFLEFRSLDISYGSNSMQVT